MPRGRKPASSFLDPETPWRSVNVALPQETGLYLCLCQYPFPGDGPDVGLFPEILAYKSMDGDTPVFRVPDGVRVKYWMPIPPCPLEPFDGIF